MKKAPRFIEFRDPPAVALAGPDQMISRALYGPRAGRSSPFPRRRKWKQYAISLSQLSTSAKTENTNHNIAMF
jgi:hypothetical protein